MPSTARNKVVAAVQAAPVFLDKRATVEKACELTAEAARNGAGLVVCPEAFVPAHPDWAWIVPAGRRALHDALYAELLENAVSVPDEATIALAEAARKSKIHVAVGVNERNTESTGKSLYNSILYIDADGKLLGKHRKLVPTGGERLGWASGDGTTLVSFDTSLGRLGGLICWENYMPLARTVMYSRGVELYVAPTWDQSESWLNAMRHIATEGGMYVVSCCMALPMTAIPDRYEFKGLYPAGKAWINKGRSVIVDPRGNVVAGPSEEKEEILYAEIDLAAVRAAKRMFDVAGHYARTDVFRFQVKE